MSSFAPHGAIGAEPPPLFVTLVEQNRLLNRLSKTTRQNKKTVMKKLLLTTMGFLCATALVVNAQDTKPKHELTDEQKAVQKEMLAKYDANKDGKLDKEERAKMSKEDKEKMDKAGLTHSKKKDAAAPAAPAAPADK